MNNVMMMMTDGDLRTDEHMNRMKSYITSPFSYESI